MATLPFKIGDDHGHDVSGLVYLEDEFLVFEVRVLKWSMIKQPTETVKADLGVIESIRFERGMFSDKIYLVPKKSDLLDAMPGTHKGELKLSIAKRYREQAEQLVAEIRVRKRAGAA